MHIYKLNFSNEADDGRITEYQLEPLGAIDEVADGLHSGSISSMDEALDIVMSIVDRDAVKQALASECRLENRNAERGIEYAPDVRGTLAAIRESVEDRIATALDEYRDGIRA